MNCAHCGMRLSGDEFFVYRRSGDALCFECTSAFVSWILDGGWKEDPEQFAHIYEGLEAVES